MLPKYKCCNRQSECKTTKSDQCVMWTDTECSVLVSSSHPSSRRLFSFPHIYQKLITPCPFWYGCPQCGFQREFLAFNWLNPLWLIIPLCKKPVKKTKKTPKSTPLIIIKLWKSLKSSLNPMQWHGFRWIIKKFYTGFLLTEQSIDSLKISHH